jgi:hypothetical protein
MGDNNTIQKRGSKGVVRVNVLVYNTLFVFALMKIGDIYIQEKLKLM